jgi:hypothetical protein
VFDIEMHPGEWPLRRHATAEPNRAQSESRRIVK